MQVQTLNHGPVTMCFLFLKKTRIILSQAKKPVMIYFTVEELFGLLKSLKDEGVEVVDEPMDEEYGKFGWIMDPEGNKIELWQPSV
jgi:predicted enzyme related to lactoylglutathione lyase